MECRMSTPVSSAGARFRAALAAESPLQVIGAINANHALLAKRAGYRAIYLSGGRDAAAGEVDRPVAGALGQQRMVGVDRADHLQRRFGGQCGAETGASGGNRGAHAAFHRG